MRSGWGRQEGGRTSSRYCARSAAVSSLSVCEPRGPGVGRGHEGGGGGGGMGGRGTPHRRR